MNTDFSGLFLCYGAWTARGVSCPRTPWFTKSPSILAPAYPLITHPIDEPLNPKDLDKDRIIGYYHWFHTDFHTGITHAGPILRGLPAANVRHIWDNGLPLSACSVGGRLDDYLVLHLHIGMS